MLFHFFFQIFKCVFYVSIPFFTFGNLICAHIPYKRKECYYCKHGDENICEHHAHSHIFHNPEGLSGYGGFGEFVVAKADDLFVYAEDTPFEKMAFTHMLFEQHTFFVFCFFAKFLL